ncbi:MAG: hypothetical protein ACRC7N_21405 [Clostridium sp.]
MKTMNEKDKIWEYLSEYGISTEEELYKTMKELVIDIGIMTTRKEKVDY